MDKIFFKMKFNRPQNYLFIFLIWMACEQQTRPILELPIDLEVIEILAESRLFMVYLLIQWRLLPEGLKEIKHFRRF